MLWLTTVTLSVVLAVLVVQALWIRWLRKRTRAPGWMLVLAGILASSPLWMGVMGIAIGLAASFRAAGGESVDTSQKARILAEGIAETMNLTAFGLLLAFLVLPLWLLGLTWRYYWSTRTSSRETMRP